MNPLFLLQGIGMISLAAATLIVWGRRVRGTGRLMVWGAVSWIVAIALKSVAALSIPPLGDALQASLPSSIADPTLWVYVGLLTGIFECGVALAAVWLIRKVRNADWGGAVAYGLGFGAVEAALLGIYAFLIVLLVMIIPEQLPPELVALADTQSASPLAIPVPIVERALAIAIHALTGALVIYAFQTRRMRWFWVALIYKTTVDTLAGYVQLAVGIENLTLGRAWLFELAMLPFALLGVWGLIALRSNWPKRVVSGNGLRIGQSEAAQPRPTERGPAEIEPV